MLSGIRKAMGGGEKAIGGNNVPKTSQQFNKDHKKFNRESDKRQEIADLYASSAEHARLADKVRGEASLSEKNVVEERARIGTAREKAAAILAARKGGQ